MINTLLKLSSIPTYSLVVLSSKFLPNHHPFKNPPSLSDWAYRRTDLCVLFDVFFWSYPITFVYVVYFILNSY